MKRIVATYRFFLIVPTLDIKRCTGKNVSSIGIGIGQRCFMVLVLLLFSADLMTENVTSAYEYNPMKQVNGIRCIRGGFDS